MNCPGVDAANPFVWGLGTGIFLGAALGGLIPGPRNARRRGRKRSADCTWLLFSLFLSAAVLFGTAGLVLAGAGRIFTRELLYFFGVITLLSTAAARYKRTVGTPLIFLLLGWFIYMQLVLTGWTCYSGTAEIAQIRVLSRTDSRVSLSLASGGSSELRAVQGTDPEFGVSVLSIHPLFIFRGGRYYYRFPEAEGRAEKTAAVIPGIQYLRLSGALGENLELFQLYRVYLDSDDLKIEAVY